MEDVREVIEEDKFFLHIRRKRGPGGIAGPDRIAGNLRKHNLDKS